MKEPLFKLQSYRYKVDNWKDRKKELLDLTNKQTFTKAPLSSFETNRSTENEEYVYYISYFFTFII